MKLTKTENIDVTYLGEKFETMKSEIAQMSLGFGMDSLYTSLDTFPVRIRYQTFSDGKGNIYNLKASDVPPELLKGQELSLEKRFISLFGKGKIVLSKELKAKKLKVEN